MDIKLQIVISVVCVLSLYLAMKWKTKQDEIRHSKMTEEEIEQEWLDENII